MMLFTALLSLAVAQAAPKPTPWCTWSDAPYTGWTLLRFPGTDLAWGQVSGDRLALSGALQDGPQGPTLQAELHDEGVLARGDVLPSDGLVFRAGATLPLGVAALLSEGAVVQPVALLDGGAFAIAAVKARAPAVTALTCGQLLLSGRFNNLDESLAAQAALGIHDDTERARLVRGRVPLAPMPGFPRAATFKRVDYDREVAVLERRGQDVRVAYPHYDGVVWYGWIKASDLQDPDTSPGPMDGILGGLGVGAEVVLRRCDADLPLRARVGSVEAEVGTIAAGTPFELRSSEADGVIVALYGSWLFAEGDAALILPVEAAACPSETLGAVPIDGLLKSAAAP